jgi:DNA invertase Pin-like site-specific DNA recombinase
MLHLQAMKAFSYLRVSGKSQVEGDGFARQRDAIARRAKADGFQVVREFADEGISGTKDMDDRPALSDLFAAIVANGVRVVIVERADRLARDVMVGEILLSQFREEGVRVIEAESGIDLAANDPDNATATLVRQIISVIAQFEKTSIVAKLRKARARRRAETGRCEGVKPFGTMPGEQDAIDRMRQLRRKPIGNAKRMSFAKIAEALQGEGFPTRTGKPWAASSVRDILNKKKP